MGGFVGFCFLFVEVDASFPLIYFNLYFVCRLLGLLSLWVFCSFVFVGELIVDFLVFCCLFVYFNVFLFSRLLWLWCLL